MAETRSEFLRVRVTPETLADVARIARANERTVSQEVRLLLRRATAGTQAAQPTEIGTVRS